MKGKSIGWIITVAVIALVAVAVALRIDKVRELVGLPPIAG